MTPTATVAEKSIHEAKSAETKPQIERLTRRGTRGSGLVAILIFLSLNLGGAFAYQTRYLTPSANVDAACKQGRFNPTICLKDWTMLMWALQNGFERTLDARLNRLASVQNPDVFLFGSSLMIFPLWFADHGDNLPDAAYYSFQSRALEKNCSQAKKIFNVSLALMSASDASRVTERYFINNQRPKVLVYGVGPRDFYDAFVGSTASSVYFDTLASFEDYTKNSKSYFPSAYDEALDIGKRVYFLYNRRADVLQLAKSLTKLVLHRGAEDWSTEKIEPLTDMGPGRNLDEYKGHYKGITAQKFDPQMEFLKQLLQTCSKRKIRVILVGMPLTTENLSLLPPHVHDAFRQKLETLAIAGGQTFVDFNNGEFTTNDFLDSAHLNEKGSHKFIEKLAPLIDAEMLKSESANRRQ